jgi:transcriptional regulator with XRE-family HTH domain
METIGFKISEIRIKKGLTQERLSEQSKINLRTLQRIEKGTSAPRGETLKNICQVLGLNMEDILDYGKKENLEFLKYFHLSVLSFLFFPFGNIILPLLLWLNNRNKIIDLNEQGINVLNYQILWTILLYLVFTMWIIFTIMSHPDKNLFLYIMGGLYLLNVTYSIIIYKQIDNGILKKFYFNPIKFLK